MRFLIPEKKFLILIILFSLVNPLNYLIFNYTAPDDHVFTGYIDDTFQLALMKSVVWGFQSPWDPGQSVFQNPVLGASYTFVALGTIPALLNINLFFVFLLIKFALSFIYLIVVYNVITRFLKSTRNVGIAFITFLFVSGLGWIIYAMFLLFNTQYASVAGYAFTVEFEELGGGANLLSHLTRIYWLVPEILGLLALLFFSDKKYIKSGILLGLSILAYPTFAVAFAAVILVFAIVENFGNKNFLMKTAENILPVAIISIIFALPWLISYLQHPLYFNEYKLWYNGEPAIRLVVSFAIVLSLSLYGFLKSTNSLLKNRIFLLFILIFGALSSLLHLYEISGGSSLLKDWLYSINVLNFSEGLFANQIIIDGVLVLLLFGLFIDVLRREIPKEYKFVLLWALIIVAMTVISTKFTFWWPARMRWLLLLPLAISSVAGIDYLINKRIFKIHLTTLKILIILVVISLPSLLAFNFYMQKVAHSSDLAYISEDDFQAMNFLTKIPDGRVLSSYQIGNNIPYYTGKTALLFNGGNDEKMTNYQVFYSVNVTEEERIKILKLYNLTYVFFGSNEKSVSSGKLNLSSMSFLDNIYDSGTQIYKII
jgi:hypothetical protein